MIDETTLPPALPLMPAQDDAPPTRTTKPLTPPNKDEPQEEGKE